jgi:predicted metal-dependent phosphoesterase TrpH
MSIPAFPRGSEWRKWDLHIHSPLSILNNHYPKLPDGKPDWPNFLDRLERTDITVIGITDYFTIEGYKEIKSFQQQEGRLQGVTIFPNIEFRLNKIVPRTGAGAEKRLTLHVLFSNEVDNEGHRGALPS